MRDHTLGRVQSPTFHSERFVRSSLTIRKNTDVVPVDAALSKLRDVFKDFRLGRMWVEDLGRLISDVDSYDRTPYPVEGELPCPLAFLVCGTLASRVQDDLLVIDRWPYKIPVEQVLGAPLHG